MASTSSRTLRLLALLQSHRYWPGADLADRLGVSLRTVRRDVERLRELGYPVQAQAGVDGGYQLAPGAALPPLVLTDEEAVALAISLMNTAQSPTPAIAEPAVQALAKIVSVLPKRLRQQVEAVRVATEPFPARAAGAGIDPNVLAAVAQSCRDSVRLEFRYRSAAGADTERRVDPHRLVSLDRRWYLVGYDLTRHEWRTFRLDRLREPRTTGTRFAPRKLPAEDAVSFVRSGLRNAPTSYLVQARVDAPADQVRRLIGRWAEVQGEAADHCRLQLRTDSLDWAIFALGVTGARFHIDDQPEVLDHLREWADRFAAASA